MTFLSSSRINRVNKKRPDQIWTCTLKAVAYIALNDNRNVGNLWKQQNDWQKQPFSGTTATSLSIVMVLKVWLFSVTHRLNTISRCYSNGKSRFTKLCRLFLRSISIYVQNKSLKSLWIIMMLETNGHITKYTTLILSRSMEVSKRESHRDL